MKFFQHSVRAAASRRAAAFTMVEIAICLAIIGFALVAIIGVLPIGMTVQKDNREQTIINFDANYLINLIRNGARDTNSFGAASLTNYVISITNVVTTCDANGLPQTSPTPVTNYFTTTGYRFGVTTGPNCLTNDANIIGLLSTPKYVFQSTGKQLYTSNYITADFRAVTGSAMDQGISDTSRDFAFSYRMTVEISPSATFPFSFADGNSQNFSAPGQLVTNTDSANETLITAAWQIAKNQQNNLNEIRLTYRWPILPNGQTGPSFRVFRSSASGAVIATNNATGLPTGIFHYITPLAYATPQ